MVQRTGSLGGWRRTRGDDGESGWKNMKGKPTNASANSSHLPGLQVSCSCRLCVHDKGKSAKKTKSIKNKTVGRDLRANRADIDDPYDALDDYDDYTEDNSYEADTMSLETVESVDAFIESVNEFEHFCHSLQDFPEEFHGSLLMSYLENPYTRSHY